MTKADQMKRLETILGAYGADRSRWPAADRAALQDFIVSDADAAARFAEETSFDGVLGLAPVSVSPVAVQGAKDRLLARFEAEVAGEASRKPAQAANVVPFAPRPVKRAAAPAPSRSLWREVSVMAAALLIGFFTVSQGMLDGSGLDLSPIGGFASVSDADDVSAIALGTTGDEVSEEDLL